jgi:hypothetical protein
MATDPIQQALTQNTSATCFKITEVAFSRTSHIGIYVIGNLQRIYPQQKLIKDIPYISQ